MFDYSSVSPTIKPGDIVKCPGGHIAEVTYCGSKCSVKYRDPDLIPPIGEYNYYELTKIDKLPCECGADGTYEHFKYCPAYKSGYDDFE